MSHCKWIQRYGMQRIGLVHMDQLVDQTRITLSRETCDRKQEN